MAIFAPLSWAAAVNLFSPGIYSSFATEACEKDICPEEWTWVMPLTMSPTPPAATSEYNATFLSDECPAPSVKRSLVADLTNRFGRTRFLIFAGENKTLTITPKQHIHS